MKISRLARPFAPWTLLALGALAVLAAGGALVGAFNLTETATAQGPISTPPPLSQEGCVSPPGGTCTHTSTRGGGYVARGSTWSLVVSIPAAPGDPRDANGDGKLTYTYGPTDAPEQGCALWPAGATVTIAGGSDSVIAAGNPAPNELVGIVVPEGDPEQGGRLSPCPGGQLPGIPDRLARRAPARPTDLRGQRGTIWVTNRTLNNVTVYAAATGAVLATIPVGKEPNDVAVPAGKGKAYVTNEADNTVSVISTRTRTVIRTVSVGPKPHHIETSLDGRRVAFGEFGTNKAGVIDTRSDALTEYTASGNPAARTHQAYPTRDGRTLFATNEVANDLAAIDLRRGQLAFTVAVGDRPSEVLVTPDRRSAYASVRNENKVKLVDLARRAIRREVVVGTQPDTLQLTPDGRTLVVALRGKPAQLVFVDTRRFTASAPVTIAGADTTAAHHFLSANGRFTFAAFEGPGAGLAVVDNETRSVVATYAYPGGGRPHGIHYADPAATSGPAIGIASRSAKVSRARIVRIAIRCGAESIVDCRGRLTLRGRGGTKLGRGSFAIRAGRRAKTRVKLSQRAFSSLVGRGRLRARAVATARDRLGNEKRASRTIVLRAPRQPSK